MRICIINLEPYSICGGAGIVTKNMGLSLSEMGHDIHLLCLASDDTKNRDKTPYTIHEIQHYSQNNEKNVIKRIIKYISYIKNLYITLVSIHPDVIQSQGLGPSYFTYIYSLRYKTPYCICFHSDPRLYIESIPSKIMIRYGKFLPFIKRANACISVSKTIIPLIEKHYAVNPIYIPNGSDTKTFYKNINSQKMRRHSIITVSRLVPEKGIEDAISAMMYIVTEYPDAKLYIVGEGELRPCLEEQVSTLSLNENVVFTGFIPNEKLITHYHDADVYLLPSWNEAFPIVLFEAMSTGLPIVSTGVGSVPEILCDDNGIIIPIKSPHIMANAVCKIFSLSDSEYQKMAENNIMVAKDNDWSRVAEKYVDIYYQCLHR